MWRCEIREIYETEKRKKKRWKTTIQKVSRIKGLDQWIKCNTNPKRMNLNTIQIKYGKRTKESKWHQNSEGNKMGTWNLHFASYTSSFFWLLCDSIYDFRCRKCLDRSIAMDRLDAKSHCCHFYMLYSKFEM